MERQPRPPTLRAILRQVRPNWKARDLDAVVFKLREVGVDSVGALKESLDNGLKKRLHDAGHKPLTSETCSALRTRLAQPDVLECADRSLVQKAPTRYCITGSWDNWKDSDEMTWDPEGSCWRYQIQLGPSLRESFQILADGDRRRSLYPDQRDACPRSPHEILGPGAEGHGRNWTVGAHLLDRRREGTRYVVRLVVSEDGRPERVDWDRIVAESTTEDEPLVNVPGWECELIGAEEECEQDFAASRAWRPNNWDPASVARWRRHRVPWQPGMPVVLPRISERAVQEFRSSGVVGPMLALCPGELRCCREGLDRFVEHCGGWVNSLQSLNNHVTLPWLDRLVRHPRIVGAVATVLNTDDVMLLSSCMFLREADSFQEHGVGWHEDGVLYEKVLSPMTDWVTAFVALTMCERENGCLQFVPPNFKTGFSQAQNDPPVHYMELHPGEFSLHSSKVTHRGGKNARDYRRDCLALRYVSGRVRDTVAESRRLAARDWVVLCSGRNGHFNEVPPPVTELGEDERRLKESIGLLRSERYGTTQFQKPQ